MSNSFDKLKIVKYVDREMFYHYSMIQQQKMYY